MDSYTAANRVFKFSTVSKRAEPCEPRPQIKAEEAQSRARGGTGRFSFEAFGLRSGSGVSFRERSDAVNRSSRTTQIFRSRSRPLRVSGRHTCYLYEAAAMGVRVVELTRLPKRFKFIVGALRLSYGPAPNSPRKSRRCRCETRGKVVFTREEMGPAPSCIIPREIAENCTGFWSEPRGVILFSVKHLNGNTDTNHV
ncbi:hypothetical protein EVAR_45843_1 [Eumeta japonica]|uniref:Uncharacterized protein n=1 Tax=Eumeta variegata TaxID=151549 RepID=A0A4C1WPI2_EUMVA|nr:hypothetical protein EVAR_45843_1 [Eumeta japonica]